MFHSPEGKNLNSRGWQPTDRDDKWVTTSEGSNKSVVMCLFDPFGAGIDFPVCTVGYTQGHSHSGPSGAGISKRHTLIQQPCPAPLPSPSGPDASRQKERAR